MKTESNQSTDFLDFSIYKKTDEITQEIYPKLT
jgi:hypothetical protein